MTEKETYDKMISKDVPNMPERLIQQSFEALEHNYDISQRAKMEQIHNEIVQIINKYHPRPEHVLLTLEIIRSEIVNNCAAMFFSSPSPPSEPADGPILESEVISDHGMEEDTVE